MYYNSEARKLETYESLLSKASVLLTISPGDTEYFGSKYGNALFIGPFHPSAVCNSLNGKGNYVLLHGDFSTAENNAAAGYLLRNVVSGWKYRTVIAGKRPSQEIMRASSGMHHVKVVPNPSQTQMTELITNAQVCLLNASQPSGMKLKLINALCSGRHVVASAPVVAGTHLESLCNIVSSPDEWISITDRLMNEDFTAEMQSNRTAVLAGVADNSVNARKIIETIHNNSL